MPPSSGNKLLGLRYPIDAEITQWRGADAQALQAKIDALLPSTANHIGLAHSGDSLWVLVEACSDQQPGLTMVYQRCGISWVGVTDMQMIYTVNWSDSSEASNRCGFQPPTLRVAEAALLKAASPLENAARITAPLLMAYGAKHRRVPLVHGEKFHEAVRRHNNQVEWMVYPVEGHGWHRPETRIDFWGRVERFLARHNTTP